MRIFDRLLVALYVALAALPVAAMLLGIRDRALNGVLPPAPPPVFAWSAVLDEGYQRALTSWFESHLGLKNTAIAVDNSILYHVFRETKHGSNVYIGEDGVLFASDDLGFYNRHGASRIDPDYLDRLVGRIARAQQLLRARKKALVPILIPSKTTIWRDKVPARWKQDLPAPLHSDEVRRWTREALARHGVRHVDAIDLLMQRPEPRDDLFGADARHWTIYGACLAMSEAATLYKELTGKPRPWHQCELSRTGTRVVDDQDLLRLINVIGAPRAYPHESLTRHEEPSMWAPRPKRLVVSTSFGWQLLFDGMAAKVYGPSYLNYYNQTFAAEDGERTPVEPGTPVWRKIVLGADLVLLDLFETYFGAPDTYVEQFVEQLIAALEEPAAATTPAR